MSGLMELFALTNQVAFITGAGRGIGRAIAIGFAEAGADIVAIARSMPQLEEVTERVNEMGRHCLPIQCDVTNAEQIKAAVAKAVVDLDKIDILVNNAGGVYTSVYALEDMPETDWDSQIILNLKSVFLCSQAVIQTMFNQGRGKIINIGSAGGFHAIKGIAPYNAAKAGIHNLTRQMAIEWGPHGIWANGIAPGGVHTYSAAIHKEHRILRGLDYTQLPDCETDIPPVNYCRAQPEEYAPIALFLASPASNHLTGEILSPGGVALRRTG
jgi:NAD(P)-dependent dehydrogenase (short-subunit alcohol dehydrogenase family)